MSKLLRKKKTLKSIVKTPNPPPPEPEIETPRIEMKAPPSEADIIVHYIIEKLLSLTVSTSFNKKVNNEFNDFCFDFLINSLNNCISQRLLAYDKEDPKNDSINNSKIESLSEINSIISDTNQYSKIQINFNPDIYFDNCKHGINDWDFTDEPISNNFDRYASSMIIYKNIEVDKENKLKYNSKVVGELLEVVNEESGKNSRSCSKENISNKDKESLNQKIEKNVKNIKFNKSIINKNIDNKKKKKKLLDINELSFHDILNDVDHYKESKDIDYDLLRKEVEQKQIIATEEKKEIKKEKIDLEKKMKEEAEKNRKYVGKRITKDHDGNIIIIKGIKLDHLKKDFLNVKTTTKTIMENLNNKQKRKSIIKKKILLNTVNSSININDNIKNENIENSENNKSTKKVTIVEKNTNNKILNPSKSNLSIESLPKIENKNTKKNNSNKTNENIIIKSRLQRRIEEGPIIPSGSNFDLMNMAIGVRIEENKKVKSGGKDFYLKYNKYSIETYNNQLKKALETNSILSIKHEKEIQNINNDINYQGNLTDTYGSSYGFINNVTNNQNKNFMTINNYNTISNFDSKIIHNSNSTSKLLKKTNDDRMLTLNPLIKVSSRFNSLMGSIDNLNLITDKNEKDEKFGYKTKNLFKNKKDFFNKFANKTKQNFDEMDKFTSQLITQKNWATIEGRNTYEAASKIPDYRFRSIFVDKNSRNKYKNFRDRIKKNINYMSSPSIFRK